MSNKPLTLKDFKDDYQHIVIHHMNNYEERITTARKLVDTHYSHVRDECTNWLRNKETK